MSSNSIEQVQKTHSSPIASMKKNNITNAFITKNGKRICVLASSIISNRYRTARIKKGENPKLTSFLDEAWRPLSVDQHVGLAFRILEANPCAVLADKDGNWVNLIHDIDVMSYMG